MLALLPPSFTAPPILMYHRVDVDRPADAVGRDLTITPQQLEQQLQALRDHGIRAISVAQWEDALERGEQLRRVVVLTFDDGYADQYEQAVPILQRFGARATFYIVTGQVGKPRHVTWSELRAMQRAGFDIAAHGVDHDDLSQMSRAQQTYQVRTSVEKLRAFVHAPVTSYAYPSGRFNGTTLNVVREAGMTLALTTDPAYVIAPENRFEISRVRVSSEWDAPQFWLTVQDALRDRHVVQR